MNSIYKGRRPQIRSRGLLNLGRVCLLGIALSALANWAIAQSDPDVETKTRIAALERFWFQSFKDRDTKAIDSILDNSVILVNYDGSSQTKGDYLASLKVAFAQPDYLESQTLPESMIVKVFGTTAIASGVYRVKGVHHGKPYQRRERFIDTWKCRSGMWLIVGTQATPVLN